MGKMFGGADLNIDLAKELPKVGDRKVFKDSGRVIVREGYDLKLVSGDEVIWALEVRRIAGGVEISGNFSGNVELDCHRCLEGFSLPFDIRMSEHALWLTSEEMEPGDDYADTYMVLDGVLDFFPVLRDAICLKIPSQRLCREDCRGICPVCGENRNTRECGCSTERPDSRLKPLEELKERLERKDR